MNTKVIIGVVGVVAAAGLGYYFYTRKGTSKTVASLIPSANQAQSNIPATTTGLKTALPAQQPATPCQYQEGQLLRAKDEVYYVDGNCLRHYVPGGVFSKYKFSTKDIKQISQAEMTAINKTNDLAGIFLT